MGLAPFFEKAALAGSHLLQEFDLDSFRQVLVAHTIGIAFDGAATSCSEGQVTLELAVNLLARLYPRLAIGPLGDAPLTESESLINIARAINPNIEISDALSDASVCLVVGMAQATGCGQPFYLGSDGWISSLSTSSPVGSGNSANPFGACAAACFGAANVFRVIFASHLKQAAPDCDLRVSLLNLDQRTGDLLNPPMGTIDLVVYPRDVGG